jgi:hypothetical protein
MGLGQLGPFLRRSFKCEIFWKTKVHLQTSFSINVALHSFIKNKPNRFVDGERVELSPAFSRLASSSFSKAKAEIFLRPGESRVFTSSS